MPSSPRFGAEGVSNHMPSSRLDSRVRKIARAALICATLALALTAPASSEKSSTLGEALEELRREGVQTLYTSRLVNVDARIDELPPAGPAEERLRALLAPLGLVALPTPDGQFVVTLAPSGLLEGTVRADPGGQLISRARVSLLPGVAAYSDAAGRFRILRVPEGRQSLEITRPGYVSLGLEIDIKAGTRHRLDATLRLDAETSDEVFVSTTSEEPPLGTWPLTPQQTRDSLLLTQDALLTASRLPGTRAAGTGVAFGVRGHDAERLTLVVDGIEIAEPYHYRHLGKLAGVVTPGAIDEMRLHRGSPPVVYGDRAGGILEVITEATDSRFTARLGAGDEADQAALSGNASGARLRWLAAYRHGRPDLPPTASSRNSSPDYWDGLAKLTSALHARHELTLQTLWASDDLSTLEENPFISALTIFQDSRYTHLRYLGALGERHVLDLTLSQNEIVSHRFGQEQEADILTPPGTDEDFVLDDRRTTRRTTGHANGVSSLGERLEWHWGAQNEREITSYAYVLFAPFRSPPSSPNPEPTFRSDEFRQNRLALYSQATWRLRDDVTLSGGARFEDDVLGDDTALMPRFGVSFRLGSAILRGGWTRVLDRPASHELLLADGEDLLPGTESSDYASLGYQVSRRAHRLSLEVYDQQIENPRPRYVNLFRSISRFPEMEIDRLRVAADASRHQGLEARYAYRGQRFHASATYELSSAEDRWPDQRWRPRRSDRRHSLHLSLTTELAFGLDADLLWRGSSGRPTTPLDIDLATTDFPAAIGEINSRRLPAEHQLDLRLSRLWRLSATTIRAMVGVDNLYDRENVLGFDLLPLRDAGRSPAELPVERNLGRQLRWSLELSW